MHLRDRTNAVIGQKFPLVQHARQNTMQALFAHEGKKRIIRAVLVVPTRDQGCEIGPVGIQPFQALLEIRQTIDDVAAEKFDGKQRDQAHHRADT